MSISVLVWFRFFIYYTNNTPDMNTSHHITLLVLLFLLTTCLSSPNPKGRQNKERSNGSCSREKCAEGRSSLKISSECVRAPFCVRQVMRELKKVSREKVRSVRITFYLIKLIFFSQFFSSPVKKKWRTLLR